MKTKQYIFILPIIILMVYSIQQWGCAGSKSAISYSTDTIFTNIDKSGKNIEILFTRGPAHNHPLMAIWITDTNNIYIDNIYIAQSIAKGIFNYGEKSQGKWLPGPIRRPASLPVWAHSRNIKEKDGLYIPTKDTPLPDGVTGATPQNNFLIISNTSESCPKIFDIYFEINQTWDWNEYWTNNKYPEDEDYKTSCQPALIYKARLDTSETGKWKELTLIGTAHYNGSDGNIYKNLETITTAKQITEKIKARIR